MAKVLVTASWLQLPGGSLFVIHLCSLDRDGDGFREEIVVRDWLDAAHALEVLLPEDLLYDAMERLTHEGQTPVLTTDGERVEILGFSMPGRAEPVPADMAKNDTFIARWERFGGSYPLANESSEWNGEHANDWHSDQRCAPAPHIT